MRPIALARQQYKSNANRSRSYVTVLSLLISSCIAQLVPAPIPVKWSPQTYGPDGPWQALRVGIGQPPQYVDLYLGSTVTTLVLLADACDNFKLRNVCSGGTYDPLQSRSKHVLSPRMASYWSDFIFNDDAGFAQYIGVDGKKLSSIKDDLTFSATNGAQKITVPGTNLGGLVFDSEAFVGFNGSSYPTYPLTAGFLPTGFNLDKVLFAPFSKETYNIPYSYLYEKGVIASASFGFTAGSVMHHIPPSFFLGGYDRNRVIGPSLKLRIDGGRVPEVLIRRLYLGNEEGPTLFPNAPSNSISNQGPSNSLLQCDIEPGGPYMYLPTETCNRLAEHLPITHDNKLGFWLWDTTDPAYEIIMKSSGYLAFEIVALTSQRLVENRNGSVPSGLHNITIKIPLQLLNLTLESPITSTPKIYFPCMNTPLGRESNAVGRSFFQAAHAVYSWNLDEGSRSYLHLSQAAGPNIPAEPYLVPILPNDTTIQESGYTWSETWAPYWKDLAKDQDSDRGLSTSAKAGIGAGVGTAVILFTAFVYFFIRQKRKQDQARTNGTDKKAELSDGELSDGKLSNGKLSEGMEHSELPNNYNTCPELPASQLSPTELGNNSQMTGTIRQNSSQKHQYLSGPWDAAHWGN